MEELLYLDHAATSWPKPPEVVSAMMEALQHSGANAGRGNHTLAMDAGRTLVRARMALADLFSVRNAQDIAFTSNTTMALNMAIKGVLKQGDHVISTMTEHNSVRRPLEFLKKSLGIAVDYLQVSPSGELDLKELQRAFKRNTKMVVCCHSSNLLGSILPVGEIGRLAKLHNAVFLVDAAQSAGSIAIDVENMHIDLLAFPGHKGLLGPQGTGGLYISPRLDLEPLMHGGTGSQSENTDQPSVRPDRYEAGTLNGPGIAGLLAGVQKVNSLGPAAIHAHEWKLARLMMEGLSEIPGMRILGPDKGAQRSGIVAFVIEGQESARIAHRLDREHQIAVRAGLHCTPLAHTAADTLGSGAVRASVGITTTEADVFRMVQAMQKICGKAANR